MNMTNNIYPIVPTKIKAFVKAVSSVPAPNFSPLVCADSVDIQSHENSYSVVFSGVKTKVNLSMIYPWIPKGFQCSGFAIADDLFTVNIKNALIN
jgi:hypothetical protein